MNTIFATRVFFVVRVKSIRSVFHCMGSSTMSCIDVILILAGTICGRRHVAFFLTIFVSHLGIFSSVICTICGIQKRYWFMIASIQIHVIDYTGLEKEATVAHTFWTFKRIVPRNTCKAELWTHWDFYRIGWKSLICTFYYPRVHILQFFKQITQID